MFKTRSFKPTNKKYTNGSFVRQPGTGSSYGSQRSYGGSNQFRRSRYGNPHRSDFGRDTSVFVKRAALVSEEVEADTTETYFSDFHIANILKTNSRVLPKEYAAVLFVTSGRGSRSPRVCNLER